VRIVCQGITPGSQAYVTTTGPDGNLWFTEYNGPRIGRFDVVARTATEFGPLRAPATAITAGPDGNVWFAQSSPFTSSSTFGRVTPDGQITEFTSHVVSGTIVAMATGADGGVWFAKNGFGGPAIGRVDPATGNVTLFATGLTGAFTLFGGMAAAGDGNVWFTDYSDGLIGRITPAGVISVFGGVLPNVQLNAITAGPKVGGLDTLWVTDPNAKSIARVTLH
jgi:streptogramin lyase